MSMSLNYWSLGNLELLNKRSHRSEKPTHCNQGGAPLATARDSLGTAMKTQRIQKYNNDEFTEAPFPLRTLRPTLP